VGGTRILVVGFGNPLMGDDGAGPAVVEELRRIGLPAGVRAVPGECDSLVLPSIWGGEEEVWLVDALACGSEPGTIRRLAHEEVLALPQRHATVHHLSLPESIRWIQLAHPEMAAVRFRFWGIEPHRVAPREGLGKRVRVAVGRVAREILETCATRSTSVTQV